MDDDKEPETYLSPRVYHILCACLTEEDDQGMTLQENFYMNGCICFEKLSRELTAQEDTYEYFERAAYKLNPTFKSIRKLYDGLSKQMFQEKFHGFLDWTSSPEILLNCFGHLKSGSGEDILLGILLSCSVLERSLGKIFLVKGSHCPSMLKDLLLTKELEDLLGDSVIQVLRIIIGPPVSLNLRNVAWHGFPKPTELSVTYGYLMIHLCVSLGYHIAERNLKLPERTWLTFPQVQSLEQVFSELQPDDLISIQTLFTQSPFISKHMLPLWKKATEKYSSGRYGECLVLLLPQFEHGMRRLFAAVNNCHGRVLTAENTVLYTTLDEILEQHLPDQSINKIRDILGDNIMNMVLDLLVHPEGPRIRDHISHGEVNIQEVPQVLATFLICLSVAICLRVSPNLSDITKQPVIEQIVRMTEDYYSFFHPYPLLQKQLDTLSRSLSMWSTVKQPSHEECKTLDMEFPAAVELPIFSEVHAVLQETFQSSAQIATSLQGLSTPFHDTTDLGQNVLKLRFKTLVNDSPDECTSTISKAEMIGILRRITNQALEASEQIREVANQRYAQFQRKQLRSRQRNTYKRILQSIPVISCGLQTVMLLTIYCLCSAEMSVEKRMQSRPNLMRLLKFTLQYCENLYSFTHIQKNKWEEATTLTKDLAQKIKKFCHFESMGK